MADVPTIEQCIASVKREVSLRGRVYPRLVAEGRMDPAKADLETACMRRVLELLQEQEPGLFTGRPKGVSDG